MNDLSHAVSAIAAAGILLSGASSALAREPKILEFDTMVGVPRPYAGTGATNAIRGIAGGGLPWVIAAASGELKASGKVEISIFGLAFDPSDPAVIAAGRAGLNNQATLNAVVSCQSRDQAGNPIVVNVATGVFPATTGMASAGGGNASVEARVALPSPCIAPIVFITNAAGNAWFAATGL